MSGPNQMMPNRPPMNANNPMGSQLRGQMSGGMMTSPSGPMTGNRMPTPPNQVFNQPNNDGGANNSGPGGMPVTSSGPNNEMLREALKQPTGGNPGMIRPNMMNPNTSMNNSGKALTDHVRVRQTFWLVKF